MVLSKFLRIVFLLGIIILTFSAFFADGYLQWVNSDTAGEAYSISQDISFPQGLFSSNPYHSRITGHILSYVPFNIVGPLYREIFNDPVNAIYISQGFMTGIIHLSLVLISAAYISSAATILSVRYLLSAALLMLFTMALPIVEWLNTPFGMSVRFSHHTVTTNYVGTLVVALSALFPYWRYFSSGNWDDLYENMYLRILFYVLIIAAVFSSTAITAWIVIIAAGLFSLLLIQKLKEGKKGANLTTLLPQLMRDTKFYPLALIIFLGIVAVGAESLSDRGKTALATHFNLSGYVNAFLKFFISSGDTKYIAFLFLFAIGIYIYFRKSHALINHPTKLVKILPWLFICNLIFIFIVGMPDREYRFEGYNLGRDTIFPATWTMSLWLFTIMISYWKEKKLIWLAPVLLFVFITNSLNFFTFPMAGYRNVQKRTFDKIHKLDITYPLDKPLYLPLQGVAFNYEDLKIYTIPMMRQAGIISPQRKVIIVP